MAKILVADDNSNVQKTVALALADLGIEVVAVNNGEAAVKKLPNVMPDLVLADIFMPVRNGYEVCEYVKKDPRFSHLPVVLLVGAFDPLDEREAQRVGADGILKKPFVPPDPLIAMVKTLLDRTLGNQLVPAAVSKPAVARQSRAGGVAVADEHEPASAISEHSQEDEAHPGSNRLSFGDGERPVAFSQLLEAPELKSAAPQTHLDEMADNEQILTSTRDESLGAPIFWKTGNPEQQSKSEDPNQEVDESAEIPAVGWRMENDAIASSLELESSKADEPLELVLDDQDAPANEVSSDIEASSLQVHDAASQASLTVEASRAADLAANPLEWMASVPPPAEEETPIDISQWSTVIPVPTEAIETKEPVDLEPATEIAAMELPAISEASVAPAAPAMTSMNDETELSSSEPSSPTAQEENALPIPHSPEAHAAPAMPAQAVEDTVRSLPKRDWSDLAASVQTPSSTPQYPPTVPATAMPAPWASLPPETKPAVPSVEDTAHSLPKHDWADLVSDLKPQSNSSNSNTVQNSADLMKKPEAPAVSDTKADVQADVAPIAKPADKNLEVAANPMPKLDWADLAASIQPRRSESVIDQAKAAISALTKASAASSLNLNVKPASAPAVATATESTSNHQDNVESAPAAATPAVAATSVGAPDPALVEAVVQRVLDKMRPQVVDIITKEFLRPVVQALVHREITKR